MNKNKTYIDPKEAKAIKTVLNRFDFGKIAIDAGISISTVNNILNGTQAITKNNAGTLDLLNKRAQSKAKKILKQLALIEP